LIFESLFTFLRISSWPTAAGQVGQLTTHVWICLTLLFVLLI